jgi:beta-lactam-binding protein with PASTA domain
MKSAVLLVTVGVAAVVISSCSSHQTPAPATVTVTQPGSGSDSGGTSPSVAAPAARITIPDGLVGENAEIAQSKLQALGLTKVELSSSNPKYSMVLRASNWTVTSIDPPPGTQVGASDPVIVKVTKE